MVVQRPILNLAVVVVYWCGGCAEADVPERVAPLSAAQAVASPVPPDPAAKLAWPRTFEEAGKTFAIHQPQVVAWEGDRLKARSAVAVSEKGAKEPKFGVVWLEARTAVDKPARVVALDELKVTSVSFPQNKSAEPGYLASIRKHAGNTARVVPLDQLEANLAANAVQPAAVEVKNDPPRILLATEPTLLVLLDGAPVLLQVNEPADVKLKRVINTRALILLDETAGRYYLHAMNGWVSSAAVEGPWALEKQPPPALERVKQAMKDDKVVDLLNPSAPEAAPKSMPKVITSTTPAELIQTVGEPKYEPVPGTGLTFVSNTDSAVFKHQASQKYYVLVSGRWFAGASLDGPWAYVPGQSMPPDFAKIPRDGPRANVLVSVPGTPEAREAVIANAIPQTAAVKISEAKVTVVYDGPPKFTAVKGTKGLMYATNCSLPVIRIDGDKSCWCVENGVWFTAKEPTGPWIVARSVPDIIYTIPASNPLHYVTYVRVYSSGPDVVYVGYTPGYFGTCVSADGVVVYGTGYAYPAYVGTVWVGYPPTYGYGAGFSYGAVSGFAFGFAAGAVLGDCWGKPYWGPCYGGGYSHIDINSSSVYRNRAGGTTSVNRSYEYDPWTGKSESKGSFSSFNPYSNRSSVGGYEGKFNRENGEYSMKRGAAAYDRDTGNAFAAGSKVTGDLDEGTQTIKRGAAGYNENTGVVKGGGTKTKYDAEEGTIDRETGQFRYNTNTDTGVARKGDDVYVGKDDNVYRKTEEGWQHKTDDGWEDTQRDPNRSAQTSDLNKQYQSRETGNQRADSYQRAGAYKSSGSGGSATPTRSSPPPSRSSGSPSRSSGGGSRGGGSRGGGGRGR